MAIMTDGSMEKTWNSNMHILPKMESEVRKWLEHIELKKNSLEISNTQTHAFSSETGLIFSKNQSSLEFDDLAACWIHS